MCPAFRLGGHVGGPIGGAKEDVPLAYRTAPASSPELTVVAVGNPQTGIVSFFLTRGMNFGLAAAGLQFCRLPAFVVGATRRFLAVPSDHYIDDLQVVESERSRAPAVAEATGIDRHPGSGHSSFISFADMVALPLSLPKRSEWSVTPSAIGALTDFTFTHVDGSVRMSVCPESREKALGRAQAALLRGSLHPSEAASLRGSLGYVLSLGRVARGVLSSITLRQYEQLPPLRQGVVWELDTDLSEA